MKDKYFNTNVRLAGNIDNADLPEKEFLKQLVSYIFEKEVGCRFTKEEIFESIDARDYNLRYFTYFKTSETDHIKYQVFVVEGSSEDDGDNIVFVDNEGFKTFQSALACIQGIVDNIFS